MVVCTCLSVALTGCGVESANPPHAACDDALTSFGEIRDLGEHREVTVHFSCAGAMQAAIIYLPIGAGPFPGVVWVHGDGPMKRLSYGPGITSALVKAGVAVLSYDKRGVGESQGVCCPGDRGDFDLIAADATEAVNSLRSVEGIDARHVGLVGASQAGWLVPVAAVRSPNVAFTAVADGPTVTQGEERLYSLLTGEEGAGGGSLSNRAVAFRLKRVGPSDFDPLPFLERMPVPGLWLYGDHDRSIPTDQCVSILRRINAAGKDFSVVTFPGAGHGLLDNPPSDPRALPVLVTWILKQAATS